MDLREYMFRKRLTNKQMAALLDCSEPQIILVRRGKQVSEKFARQLEKATDGEVKRSEVVTKATIITLPTPDKEDEDKRKMG